MYNLVKKIANNRVYLPLHLEIYDRSISNPSQLLYNNSVKNIKTDVLNMRRVFLKVTVTDDHK